MDQAEKDAEEARWWAEWFAADYSWEGLAKLQPDGKPEKPWRGWVVALYGDADYCMSEDKVPKDIETRPATLQDYWRGDSEDRWRLRSDEALREAYELTREDRPFGGKHWHIAHHPDRMSDGARGGWKVKGADPFWDRLGEILVRRLAVAEETKIDANGLLVGSDRRAQFDGAVLRSALPKLDDEASPLHVSARLSVHLSSANYEKRVFGSVVDFDSTRFADAAWFRQVRVNNSITFDNVSFTKEAVFDYANFGGDVYFNSASFAGYTKFGSVSFVGCAYFNSATFAEHAKFDSTKFAGYADFDAANFGGGIWFGRAHFAGDAEFENASFAGDAKFENASFVGHADFANASFAKHANFYEASFTEDAWFKGVSFSGDAKFETASFSKDAMFNSARFAQEAVFESTSFGGDADFIDTKFTGVAKFGSASFAAEAWFSSASFAGEALFYDIIFNKPVYFNRTQFSGETRFDRARFKAVAAFTGVAFANPEVNWRSAFDAAVFENLLDFRESQYRLIAMFDGARLDGGIAYPKLGERAALRIFDKEVLEPIELGAPEAREAALNALEHGARTLKHQMRAQADHLREQRFYRYELKARRRQKGTRWPERWSSRAFGFLADYGLSFARPLGALLATTVIFCLLYFLTAPVVADMSLDTVTFGWGYPVHPAIGDAIELSLSNMLGPIRYWASNFKPYADAAGPDPGFAFRFVMGGLSMIQQVLSVTLLFLAAVALRRRFQIA